MHNNTVNRKTQLKETVESYFQALKEKNFATIPYHDSIIFRSPLAPGGAQNPISGKQAVFDLWWKPLEPALDGVVVNIIDHYYNESLSGMLTKAEIILPGAGITLRVADRFVISEEGKISEQENHFDASQLKSYIHHICLRSMDFNKTKKFYQNVLGFPIAIDTPDLIIFIAGNVFLAFKKADPRNKEFTTFSPYEVGLDHIAITCESEDELNRYAKKLADEGVENTGVKVDKVLNKLYVAFKDPDRIAWEFYMK